MAKVEEAKTEVKSFTKPEIERLRQKAETANKALAEYHDWLAFLREQHEAPEHEQWTLGEKGFVRDIVVSTNGHNGSE